MESFHYKDSSNMNSSTDQEVDQPNKNHQHHQQQTPAENGIGRSYECVFCKRGFNTAQALGGHMNIHRKDRIKTKPNQISSIQNNGPYRATTSQLSYQTYFPTHSSVTSTTSPFLMNGHHNSGYQDHNNNRQCLNLFGDDWRMSLSLQFGTHVVEGMEMNKRPEDDLDLELRLGHDP